MDAGRCAGIFAKRPTEWIAVSNPGTCQHYYAIFMHSACVHVHMHMYTYALCGYAAIHVNRPSGISQAAAIAANSTQAVKHP